MAYYPIRLPWEKTVVKANDLIQKSRFDFSIQEQKIILYLISQINPTDKDFTIYEFKVGDFCRICGISNESGKNYADLKQAIKHIADQSVWIKIEDEETLLRWIEKPYINKHSGTIKIRLDEDMKPFLLQLKRDFTEYEILWTLRFRCKYSIRLYEVIKSIHYNEFENYSRDFLIDDLRRMLGAETYTTYQTFKTRALIPAINEINTYSDKEVSYTPLKEDKKVVRIKLSVQTKSIVDKLKLQAETESKLGLDQIKIDFDEGEEYGRRKDY